MKTFRNYISEVSGLRYIYENLDLKSSAGRNKLLNSEMLIKEFELKTSLRNLNDTYDFVKGINNSEKVNKITLLLSELNDISSSIKNLSTGQIFDDIELFEIKKFSLVSQNLRQELEKSGFYVIMLHDLSSVVNILDPQKSGIPSFYIYSEYDEELAELRRQKDNCNDETKTEELRLKCIDAEDRVRKNLCKDLRKFDKSLEYNLNRLADIDILIAKAKLAVEMGFCEPKVSVKYTKLIGIVNPLVNSVLQIKNKAFQPVDIQIYEAPAVITGANMSGKSVLLKSVALCQYMFQFGFYVPAKNAEIQPVEEIIISIGDNQDELNGLSSFAVEMLNINRILSLAKSGKKILALIDEPARTTNPDEGKAIVNAILEILNRLNVSAIISTHYSGINTKHRFRVKGLKEIGINQNVNIENINDFMDYSITNASDEIAPAEAIRIAEILGIDFELIEKSTKNLEKELNKN